MIRYYKYGFFILFEVLLLFPLAALFFAALLGPMILAATTNPAWMLLILLWPAAVWVGRAYFYAVKDMCERVEELAYRALDKPD